MTNEAVRQWVRNHAYSEDDIVVCGDSKANDDALPAITALLDAADPEWRIVFHDSDVPR